MANMRHRFITKSHTDHNRIDKIYSVFPFLLGTELLCLCLSATVQITSLIAQHRARAFSVDFFLILFLLLLLFRELLYCGTRIDSLT